MNWRAVLAGIVVVLVGIGVVSAQQQPAPAPTATSTTSSTTSTIPAGTLERWTVPAEDGACELLNQATAGTTVWLDARPDTDTEIRTGNFADDTVTGACSVRGQDAYGVIVTGSWTGDVQCHGCDGWRFEGITVKPGSLRMIGGREWTIADAEIHGGNRGQMSVLGTGSTDASEVQTKSPYRWQIRNVDVGGAGCREAGDKEFRTHVRALYLVGKNSTALGGLWPNEGFVTDSKFWGHRCGYTVKIGATGGQGVHNLSGDAADVVTFANNTVEMIDAELPEGVPEQAIPLLVSGHSDSVTITGNTLIGGTHALMASGPFTGHDLVFTDNTIDQPQMIWWRRYGPPQWWQPNVPLDSPLAYLMGESFATFPLGPCRGLGTCGGNTT